jgi:elongator complex protein 1
MQSLTVTSIKSGPQELNSPLASLSLCAPGLAFPLDTIAYTNIDTGFLLATSDNSLLLFTPDGQEPPEDIGTMDAGIQDLVSSPDGSVVVIVTSDQRLVMLETRGWGVVIDVSLVEEKEGAEDLVALGWGSQETQFQGSMGKTREAITQARCDARDDGRIVVSWRGDGAYFAVSLQADERRVIQVYSRDGGLVSKSEGVDMLQHTLAWRSVNFLYLDQVGI